MRRYVELLEYSNENEPFLEMLGMVRDNSLVQG